MSIALVRAPQLGTTSGSSSINVTVTASTIGNTMTAVVTLLVSTLTVTGITDNGGNTWTFQAGYTTIGNNIRAEIWTAPVTGSCTTVTITCSGSITNGGAYVSEYSGVAAIVNVGTNTGTTSTATITLTMQDANNFLVAGMTLNASGAWTVITGTIEAQSAIFSSSQLVDMDNTSASPGSVTCSANTGGTRNWNVVAVELRSTITPTCFEEDSYCMIGGAVQDSNVTIW
jgi:hypothetical protein